MSRSPTAEVGEPPNEPTTRSGWRDVVRSMGGLAAVALAGCSAIDDPSGGSRVDPTDDPPDGAIDCVEDPTEADGYVVNYEQRSRAGRYLLEQLREGLPSDVLRGAEAIGEAARESVAYLELFEGGFPIGHATGWFIDEGVIATNAHNIAFGTEVTEEIRGYTSDGRSFETTVVGSVEDHSPDVAVLTTDLADAPGLPVRRNADLEPGEPLVQVGHPGGFGNWVISAGRFAGRSTPTPVSGFPDLEFSDLTTSVPGLTGVSGSPVLDLHGEVVAMTHGAESLDTRGFGDAVRVAPDRVFDTPISEIGTSLHVEVDVVVELVDRWA